MLLVTNYLHFFIQVTRPRRLPLFRGDTSLPAFGEITSDGTPGGNEVDLVKVSEFNCSFPLPFLFLFSVSVSTGLLFAMALVSDLNHLITVDD